MFDGQYMLSSELVQHFEFSRQHKYYYPANHIFSISGSILGYPASCLSWFLPPFCMSWYDGCWWRTHCILRGNPAIEYSSSEKKKSRHYIRVMGCIAAPFGFFISTVSTRFWRILNWGLNTFFFLYRPTLLYSMYIYIYSGSQNERESL